MTVHETEHRTRIEAPADVVLALVRESCLWPAVFAPSVHVEHLERDDDGERFRIWATVNGRVADWSSRRRFDAAARRVEFAQERPMPPLAAMSGAWLVVPDADDAGVCEVVLTHRFSLSEESAQAVARMRSALDTNSEAELSALAAAAEAGGIGEAVLAFTDVVTVEAPPDAVYDFLLEAQEWPNRLSHVAGATITPLREGVHELELDTVTPDGSRHRTRSVRVCSPGRWIAYKQVLPPRVLSGHAGLWLVEPAADGGTRVSATHTVAIRAEAVEEVYGAGTTTAQAGRLIRDALSANSRATLAGAHRHHASRVADAAVASA